MFYVSFFVFSVETKIKALPLISKFSLSKKRNGTLGTRIHYKCHKINLNCNGSNIDSPDWIKNKQALIYPINDGDKCFQYAATVAINHEKNGKSNNKIMKIIQIMKSKLFFYDSERRRIALKLSVLLRGIMSKRDGDFYCLNYLHSFRTKKT